MLINSMEYKNKSTSLQENEVYSDKTSLKTTNLGGLELKQFKEIEGWLFDCSSGK